MNHVRFGHGRPLLLVHGLGGHWRSWTPVLPMLAAHREIVAVDLPGHGASPVEPGCGRFAGLADRLDAFLDDHRLAGVDVAGSSMGARLALELARRGRVGAVAAMDPGGFWRGWERTFFRLTIGASVRLLRVLRPALPALCGSAVGRTLLLPQLSHRPWRLDPVLTASELRAYADCPVFDELVHDLAVGPPQTGPAAPGCRVAIGWGRRDRLCLPRQAARATEAFPSATLQWFDGCGHFPIWDRPEAAAAWVLAATDASASASSPAREPVAPPAADRVRPGATPAPRHVPG
ncbi:MAG TPA: alpha/beta fold hydrolase [Burkholderiaceae bacterium]|nr:alpha/beta fold hydrolase [Burkholderiaceae bacterium]